MATCAFQKASSDRNNSNSPRKGSLENKVLFPAVLSDSKELDSFLEFTTGQQPGHLGCFSSGPVLAKEPNSHRFDKHTSPPSSS